MLPLLDMAKRPKMLCDMTNTALIVLLRMGHTG